MQVRICVTKNDIAKGKPRKSDTCAVARAVSRVVQVPLGYRLGVGWHQVIVRGTAALNKHTSIPLFDTPPHIREFIKAFDGMGSNQHLKPTNFEADIPDDYLKPQVRARRKRA